MHTTDLPALETPRLHLRALRLDDFDAFASMWTEPAVVRFVGGEPLTRDASWARFLRQMGMWHYLGFGTFAVDDKASGALAGIAGFHDLKRTIVPSLEGSMEAGWVLASAFHGKGMAEEAMRAVLAWADRTHAGKRITCIIRPGHLASLRVAAKLQFSEVARTDYDDAPIVVLERRVIAGDQR